MSFYEDNFNGPGILVLKIYHQGPIEASATMDLGGVLRIARKDTLGSTYLLRAGQPAWEKLTRVNSISETATNTEIEAHVGFGLSSERLTNGMAFHNVTSLKALWTKLSLLQTAERERVPSRDFYRDRPVPGTTIVLEMQVNRHLVAHTALDQTDLVRLLSDRRSTYFLLIPEDTLWKVVEGSEIVDRDGSAELPYLFQTAFGETDLDSAMRWHGVSSVYNLWITILRRQQEERQLSDA